MIPQAVLDQIQDRSDIVNVISQYVPLRRLGQNYKAPCPFHIEKTPSFVVSAEKQIFHCFGCNAGGNVFTFVMQYEKLPFREAVKKLADQAGIIIEEDESFKKQQSQKEPFLKVHELAKKFYVDSLNKQPKDSVVQKYIEKRGFTKEALSKFNIGYSLNSWDAFSSVAKKHFKDPFLLQAGLVLKKQQGDGVYDRFRNRLMFPISNAKGEVVGFGARVLDDSLPKYINSPETPIYYKSRILYGLHEASESIRQKNQVLLVEGYMDVIACFQGGVTNVVSASGTALTVDQIRILKRYTNSVVVLFDSDQAGQSATLRGLDLLVAEGCSISIATMPKDHDPDSYIRSFGKDIFEKEILEKAKSLFDYKFGLLTQENSTTSVEGKVRIAQTMLATIRRIPNEILKMGLVRELAEKLAISEESLVVELNNEAKKAPVETREVKTQKARVIKESSVPLAEKMVIGFILSSEEIWQRAKEEGIEDAFKHPSSQKVVKILFESSEWEQVKPSKIINHIQEDQASTLLVQQALNEVESVENKIKAFEDCTKRFREGRDQIKRRQLREKIAQCEKDNDVKTRNQLLKEFELLSKKGK